MLLRGARSLFSTLMGSVGVFFLFFFRLYFLYWNTYASTSAMYQDIAVPANSRKAVFGTGCFWGPDGEFPGLRGVYRTTVGYAGGKMENPTYKNIGDHTEVIEVEYCPDEISYKQLLTKFWDCNDNMYTRHGKRQYISLILYNDDQEKQLAEESYEEVKEAVNRLSPVPTEIRQFHMFYKAEDYHQKYHLQHDDQLMDLFGVTAKHIRDGSTIAAKLSAFVMGYGSEKELEWLKSKMDLSEQQEKTLALLVKIGGTAAGCH